MLDTVGGRLSLQLIPSQEIFSVRVVHLPHLLELNSKVPMSSSRVLQLQLEATESPIGYFIVKGDILMTPIQCGQLFLLHLPLLSLSQISLSYPSINQCHPPYTPSMHSGVV